MRFCLLIFFLIFFYKESDLDLGLESDLDLGLESKSISGLSSESEAI